MVWVVYTLLYLSYFNGTCPIVMALECSLLQSLDEHRSLEQYLLAGISDEVFSERPYQYDSFTARRGGGRAGQVALVQNTPVS